MTISLQSGRPDAFTKTMRQRLEAIISFLGWTVAMSAELSPRPGASCRFRIKRQACSYWWDETEFVIDLMNNQASHAEISWAEGIEVSTSPEGSNIIYGVMTEQCISEQLAANLRLLSASKQIRSSDDIAREVLRQLAAGQAMTRAVLEARLAAKGFDKQEIGPTVLYMVAGNTLSTDLRQPLGSGSLLRRPARRRRAKPDSLPWTQIPTIADPAGAARHRV